MRFPPEKCCVFLKNVYNISKIDFVAGEIFGTIIINRFDCMEKFLTEKTSYNSRRSTSWKNVADERVWKKMF